MKKTINLSDIIISSDFAKTTPGQRKMDWVRDYYRRTNHIDKPIVIDENNLLIDGYIRYLVLLENNVATTVVKVVHYNHNVIYVFGKYPNGHKEYSWKMAPTVGEDEIPDIGQKIFVQTKYGLRTAVVTRIETPEKKNNIEIIFEDNSRVRIFGDIKPIAEPTEYQLYAEPIDMCYKRSDDDASK